MMPPRLLAVAPPDWQKRIPQFREELQQFARHVAPLGPRAAVYLRAHEVAPRTWQRWLHALELPSLGPVRIGVTAPRGDDGVPFVERSLRMLTAAGVHFVHLPATRPPARWMLCAGPAPRAIALTRAFHVDGPQDFGSGDPFIDWILVSPVFPTPTKPGQPALGLDGLARSIHGKQNHVVALGGIDAANAREVLATGVAGVACLRAAWSQAPALCAACT